MAKQENSTSVTSVIRVFGILEELAKERELGLSDLAKRMYMSKSTIFRFLQTMKELDYVSQDPVTERYSLTVKLFQIGLMTLDLHDLNKIANKHMIKLAHRTCETVHLAILDAESRSIIYVHKVDAEYSLSLLSRIGKKAPLHCTALGKVLMAYSDEDTLREVLRGLSYREYTPKTINNEADYLKELEKVRNQGYGEDLCEHEENICCLAAPIRDRFGNVVAGMSITWPEFRFSEDEKDTYLEWIMETANAISKDLGYIA
ncbi:DNA-binding transcriptional regulator KdgR [Sediminispirochaeta smaragdinae]|uniref:Transcriptional regulator, IclR family n=1 Tax=Sediminispirochaeta smaragdinae (strain DSM 11293 / JCM 15392 / SEBR 4228) TaxID=573413 RepID=E1RCH0_SEDSS|nr:DNA-binding transcriptional regulator KdgR [Sediminispirochaeta smaragdinae]ADK80050.1 transcriptional regulator, IclR family [Sediminispirochaeta smaragdinae DSM 11293]